MTTFEERERAFEAKYAHDEEFRFLVTARRDKLFAHWAAERLHLPAAAEADLTASTLAVKDGPGHDERVLHHMTEVFRVHRGSAHPADLTSALERCADQARQQLLANHTPLS